MTYANPALVSTSAKKTKDLELLWDENTAVGEESSFIFKQYKYSVEHYLIPFSRQWINPAIRFNTLKTELEMDTAHLSSITDIAIHPAYQQIIGMGAIAIPYILATLRGKPGHWFWALKSITGEDPVPPDQRGRIKQMTEIWLRWGKEQGYI